MSESKASVTWQENKAFMGVSPSGIMYRSMPIKKEAQVRWS
ncbi:OsmC/Ohr family protein [Psychrobacter sp. JCM 18902]|nr:OsmC/Ohr family protein [Psychrobacter sp. JCM 18902]